MKKLIISSLLLGSALFGVSIDEANKALNDQKYTQALEMFKQLCDGDKPDSKACSSLGYMYQSGKGVNADLDTSSKYYKKACDLGDKVSCNNAGWN